jgi:hypothetical protein
MPQRRLAMSESKIPEKKKTSKEQEKDLEAQLEDTFPASDPPAAVQPGSNIHKHRPEKDQPEK